MPTFDTPNPISATIDVAMGDVRVNASDRGATVVAVHPSDASNEEDLKAAELTRVEYANEQLLVKAPKLRSWLNRSARVDRRDDRAARRLERARHRAMGDFHCDGRLGDCRIKTGLGRIQVDQADTLNLKSGAGDISVDRCHGPRRGHGRLGRRARARARRAAR